MPKRIRPTKKGRDLGSADGKLDAHVRLEKVDGKWMTCVDIFDSSVKDANRAWVDSDTFPATVFGARAASRYLKDNGFDVHVAYPGKVNARVSADR